MKRLALFLLTVLVCAGQDLTSVTRTATGNITGANASCLGFNCVWITPPANTSSITVQISGTFTGTVQFEATTNGTVYSSIAATNTATSATGTGTWSFAIYGYQAFRVRASAYTNGTIVVSIGSSTASVSVGGSIEATTAPLKGDNAGNAVAAEAADVVGLWDSGSCSGYLKNDGTCSTPTATPGGVNQQIQFNNAGALAGAQFWTVNNSSGNWNASGTLSGTTNASWWAPNMTYSSPGQIQMLSPTVNYTATSGGAFATVSFLYGTSILSGNTGGTHGWGSVHRMQDTTTGGTITNQGVVFADYIKSGSGAVGTAAAFHVEGMTVSGGSVGTVGRLAAFELVAAPTGDAGKVGAAYGFLTTNRFTTSTTGPNVGVMIGGTSGPASSGAYTPLYVVYNSADTKTYIPKLSMSGQDMFPTNSNSSILDFGSTGLGTVTNGQSGTVSLITGEINTFTGSTVAGVIGINVKASNLHGTGAVTAMRAAQFVASKENSNGGTIGTNHGINIYAGTTAGAITTNYGIKIDDIGDVANSSYGTNYGIHVGKVRPTTGSISGTAYSAYFSDANGLVFSAGNLQAKSLRGTAVTFANVPATPVEGMLVAVTDSSTATWGDTITGGGANHVLAYYNGTNWTVAGK